MQCRDDDDNVPAQRDSHTQCNFDDHDDNVLEYIHYLFHIFCNIFQYITVDWKVLALAIGSIIIP